MNSVIDAHFGCVHPSAGTAATAEGDSSMSAAMRSTLAQCRVEGAVVVEPDASATRARRLLDLANASAGLVRGVVIGIDLAAADAIPTLTRLARDPLFKAVHLSLVDAVAGARVAEPGIARTLAALPRLGLRLDVLAPAVHLPLVAMLARRHPDIALALEHAGMPPFPASARKDWLAGLRDLAALPRVRCKVSALVTQAGPGWTIDTLRPAFDEIHALFGAGRLMWGSDWPGLAATASYKSWYAASLALTAEWPMSDRGAFFGGSARRFYGL